MEGSCYDPELNCLIAEMTDLTPNSKKAKQLEKAVASYGQKGATGLQDRVQSIRSCLQLDKELLEETQKSISAFSMKHVVSNTTQSDKLRMPFTRANEVWRGITKKNEDDKFAEIMKKLGHFKNNSSNNSFVNEKVQYEVEEFVKAMSSLKNTMRKFNDPIKSKFDIDPEPEISNEYSKIMDDKAKYFLKKMRSSKVENLDTALAVRKVATRRNSYIQADGDPFQDMSDEEKSPGDGLASRTWTADGFSSAGDGF